MISLRDNRLQIMSGTGRVMVSFLNPFMGEPVNYNQVMEICQADFTAIGMPHVFGIESGRVDAQMRLMDEMEIRNLKFEHWSSINVSSHAFFGFSKLSDAMLARLLI